MNHEVLLHPKADDFLENADNGLQRRIKKKLKTLSSRPKKGKKLKHSDFWRLRIGDYRAIYKINQNDKKVIVLFIGHRKDVYDDFSKLI